MKTKFVCDRCGEINKVGMATVGKEVSCSKCGNQQILDNTDPKSVLGSSFSEIKQDDFGKFFTATEITDDRLKQCDKCDEILEEKNVYFGEKRSQFLCESCRKTQVMMDGIPVNDDDSTKKRRQI